MFRGSQKHYRISLPSKRVVKFKNRTYSHRSTFEVSSPANSYTTSTGRNTAGHSAEAQPAGHFFYTAGWVVLDVQFEVG